MPDDKLLGLLTDWRALSLAYTASSTYVMRRSFEKTEALQAFRGRSDLAEAVWKQYQDLALKGADCEILAAHLYALELADAPELLRRAVAWTLTAAGAPRNPHLAQFAGQSAVHRLAVPIRLAPGADLDDKQLDEIRRAVRREG